MTEIREQVLQLLLAGMMAGLFSLLADRVDDLTKGLLASKERRHEWILIGSCIPVILLCLLFQSARAPLIPHSGFIPLTAALLYANVSTAFILTLLTAIGSILFTPDSDWMALLIDSGILLAPAAVVLSSRYKRGKPPFKLTVISALVLAQFALHYITVLVAGGTPDGFILSEVPLYLCLALLSVLTACMISLMIERALNNRIMRSDLKQATARLQLESGKLRAYLEYMPLAAEILDRQGNIIHINTTMLEYYRLRIPDLYKENVVGMHFSMFAESDRFQEMASSFDKALQGERDTRLFKSGPYVYMSSISPIYEPNGEVSEALYVVQDMTELEMLRSEMGNVERLSLVGQMAAGITHEIRNPMAVVRGFLQLMREKSPVSLDHYYRIVMEELDRANGIINDFLSLAQNRIVEKEESHLHSLVEELEPLLWADANLRGQSIELKLDDCVPNLYLNPKEIKQLILNLARNGMEAMGEKGVLTILTRTDGEYVEVEVRDTGQGIPAERIGKLFEPFFTTKAKGTGLGLSLCKRIVERHHGTISVHSIEGEGTSFIIKLSRLADFPAAVPDMKSSKEA
ncbi:two-component system sensor histidine kinase NtrB [Paenibacillus jiagnxiensis]|uniref:two-component system sensor histidine kinase NtrB n=1 Tax=Paenibacillus jiagnxiensis TaxID=3228926 RepID=UPI0033AC4D5F